MSSNKPKMSEDAPPITSTPVEVNETKDLNEFESAKVDRLKRKIYTPLPCWEMTTYTMVWISSVIYAAYCFYTDSKKYFRNLPHLEPFDPWWNPFSSPFYLDKTDHEWNTWKDVARHRIYPLVILYPVLSQIVKKSSSDFAVHFSALYSVMCTMYLIGVYPVLYLFIQIFIIYFAYCLFHTGWAIWIVALVMGQSPDYYPLNVVKDSLFRDYEAWKFGGYLTAITYAWINTRCVSFCLDRVWGRVEREKSLLLEFISMTAFCFYLPLGIMGPLITSKQFKEGLQKSSKLDWNLLKFALLQGVRYYFWFNIADLLLSTCYHQAFVYKPFLVRAIGMWSLCGMSYLLGQYFQLKYVVMYGVSSVLAKLDDMDAPPHPKCIARIHLYSDMWRHFDVGLYHFMHTYIYQPINSFNSGFIVRTVTSLLIFGFVYVWHGRYDFVLIWSILNCTGVLCENLGREIGKWKGYTSWETGTFGLQGQRRFHALISTPLYLMSCLSNFYFFTGKEVGDIIAERCFMDTWPYGFPFLLFVLYCGSHFSIEVKNWEIKCEIKDLEKKKID